jgi:hypothetical protein
MLEQDIGRYLGMISTFIFLHVVFLGISIAGIPSNVDLNQLEDHWRKCYRLNPHALTILTKLVRNMEEVLTSEII